MRQRRIPSCGLEVSNVGLGTLRWGLTNDLADAGAQLKLFAEHGGTLVDTASVYGGDGRSERMLGELMRRVVDRHHVVVATKAALVPGGPPHKPDTSRAGLLSQLEASLTNLQTDFIDLWQLHVWNPHTALDETLSALDAAIESGKVRYAGICNYAGWQTAMAAQWQRINGAKPLATAQVEYSLLQRGIEREVMPAAAEFEMGIIAWGSLGRGVLTGKYRHGIPDKRLSSNFFNSYVRPYVDDDGSSSIVSAVVDAAGEIGMAPMSVALAWVRDQEHVASALVGARDCGQLSELLAADQVELPTEVRKQLDRASAVSFGYPERQVGP
jgi:aryl-alcohol dehydrogenase-like predicted oxidoreductase